MTSNRTQNNIYLIGYRATGKTVVGKALARKLNRRFIDADQYIEQAAQMPISEIVSRFGWDEFRRSESAVIAELSNQDNLVVATGGGVVLDPQNVNILKQTGIVVWLDASPDTIIARMQNDPQTKTQRPSLSTTTTPLADEVIDTLTHRLPLYDQTAHIRIDTTDTDMNTICRRIIHFFETRLPP